MIVREHFVVNGREFVRTYSDSGRYIVGGWPYGEYPEACDPVEFDREYVEGELMPEYGVEDKAEAYEIMMGERE